MDCTECEKIKNKKNLVYEDSLVIAILDDKPATGGQISLLPKEHYTIIEKIPDNIISHMFSVANKLSIACFDALGAHGTNILIRNGIAAGQRSTHTMIHIIPRAENDGVNLNWEPQKADEGELDTTQTLLKEELEKPMEEPKKEIKEEVKEEVIEEIPEEENYLLKQLERVP